LYNLYHIHIIIIRKQRLTYLLVSENLMKSGRFFVRDRAGQSGFILFDEYKI